MLTLLLACLAGCAANQGADTPAYGNLLAALVPAQESGIAGDAAMRLAASYPPAQTRFALQHAAQDGFGTDLLARLRAQGYAVAEFSTQAPATATLQPPAAEAIALRYVLDMAAPPGLARLTLYAGGESLSRAYLLDEGAARPASAWIRREAAP
ncbi:conjugal transfer protein TrbH [Janthinobacterium sp. J1-1]|uniref:conjugal transfer protein TrbH n=1 Tax=Janthinobacterium sp. J1-1 TaxID=3065910 RepID=UPI002811E1B5|nr:conjugal transfer protein TrbH [Janthinobacterium sp. J1-1]